MRIVCNQSQQLGHGSFSRIFQGTLDKTQKVAVKRIELAGLNIKSDKSGEEALLHLDHPNVIKLLYFEDDPNFRFYALELCEASLDKLYSKDNTKYCGPVPPLEQMFFQLADGLQYIHENKLVRRDIKPENVLIWVGNSSSANVQALMKWADFGFCKPTNISGSFSISALKGTLNWFAPELLIASEDGNIVETRGTNKSDVFAEGLIFGYILLEGKHPFGNGKIQVLSNLTENNPVNLKEIPEKHQWLVDELIHKQIKLDPAERMTAGEVFQYLQNILPTGANSNGSTGTFEKSEIHRAALNETIEGPQLVKLLLEEGGDPNTVDEYSRTPLHYAVQNISNFAPEIIHLLLESGGNPNRVDDFKRTPLHYAAQNISSFAAKIIQILLESGGNQNSIDENNRTPLHYAAQSISSSAAKIMQLLLEQGGNPNNVDEYNRTPLHYAAMNKSSFTPEIIQLLLKSGGNPNGFDDLKRSPRQYAQENTSKSGPKILQLLV